MTQQLVQKKTHYFWIDAVKGVAVIGMIFFHLCVFLNYIALTTIDISHGVVFFIGRVSALLFIVSAGINFELSQPLQHLQKIAKRFFMLLSFAYCITLVTYISIPELTVYFGILHFFAWSTLFVLPLYLVRRANVATPTAFCCYLMFLGVLQLALFFFYSMFEYQPFLLAFGYYTDDFASLDYYPLFPWIYALLLGIGIGVLDKDPTSPDMYMSGIRWTRPTTFCNAELRRTRKDTDMDKGLFYKLEAWYINVKNSSLELLGKHSLVIYLLHMPIIFGLYFLFRIVLL